MGPMSLLYLMSHKVKVNAQAARQVNKSVG
jgi:hypothetical protein